MSCYFIVDNGNIYIPREFKSKTEAEEALADLLLPFAAGDPWRKRIVVRQYPKTPSKISHKTEFSQSKEAERRAKKEALAAIKAALPKP